MTELATQDRAVQRSLLGVQVAEALRRDIWLGVLRPGTRLAQQQLCERFGTSRMPVRDGLRALVQDGLLMVDEANRTVVAPVRRSDLLDAFIIEASLAGIAAERAAKLINEGQVDELEDLHQRMLVAALAEDQVRMANLNWEFHRRLNRLSGSRKLLAVLRASSIDVPRDYLVQLPEWNGKSNAEHAVIMSALRARDGAATRRAVVAHVLESGQGLIAYLEAQGLAIDESNLSEARIRYTEAYRDAE